MNIIFENLAWIIYFQKYYVFFTISLYKFYKFEMNKFNNFI